MPTPPRTGARIAHIGIAVQSVDALMPFYRDVLGMDIVPLDDSDGARISGFAAGTALVELLEPAVADSPIGKFIAKRGPGIHHIAVEVDDIITALQKLKDKGMRLIDKTPRVGAENCLVAFVHPSSTGGVLLELVQTRR